MPIDLLMSASEEVAKVYCQRPHVVLLGAGASLAAFPNGAAGKRLPVMSNFVEVVGLTDLLDATGVEYRGRNFELVFSELVESTEQADAVRAIERRIYNYFADMRLPAEPTIYDYLVLSLRPKDIIATFNWDPFLFAACARASWRTTPPRIYYLHGGVACGYCEQDETAGSSLAKCSRCGEPFTPTPLLYPVSRKDYTSNPYIRRSWEELRRFLGQAFVFTVFGYGAPAADVGAVDMLKAGWGHPDTRELEEMEIIDIRDADELMTTWSPFIHTHHYQVKTDFFSSWLANHPRRSCEAMWAQLMECRFLAGNPVKRASTYEELWASLRPLIQAEEAAVAGGDGV